LGIHDVVLPCPPWTATRLLGIAAHHPDLGERGPTPRDRRHAANRGGKHSGPLPREETGLAAGRHEVAPRPVRMRLALAGDTMLGRGVADTLRRAAPGSLVEPGLADVMRSADLTILNLECCISDRGAPIPLPGKPFF